MLKSAWFELRSLTGHFCTHVLVLPSTEWQHSKSSTPTSFDTLDFCLWSVPVHLLINV